MLAQPVEPVLFVATFGVGQCLQDGALFLPAALGEVQIRLPLHPLLREIAPPTPDLLGGGRGMRRLSNRVVFRANPRTALVISRLWDMIAVVVHSCQPTDFTRDVHQVSETSFSVLPNFIFNEDVAAVFKAAHPPSRASSQPQSPPHSPPPHRTGTSTPHETPSRRRKLTR